MGSIPKQVHEMKHSRSVEQISHSRSQIVEQESKYDNDISTESIQSIQSIPEAVSEYIDESHTNTQIHLGEFQNLKWAPLYADDFWTCPAKLFHESYSDSFVKKIHHDRGSTQLKIGEWEIDDDEKTPDNQPKTYVRKLEYISKIKDPPPFMPSKTEVYETQRFRFYGSNCVVVDLAISTPNIKYGDYFLICNRFIFSVHEQDENKTHMDCSIAYKWIKKTWFEKIITSKATSEAEEGMAFWSSKLHELFPPKVSQQAILQKQLSQKQSIGGEDIGSIPISPKSPRGKRRVIDKKVIDYFHTPRKRKDIIIEDWLKPFGEIGVDIFKEIFKLSSWKKMFNLLLKIDDPEQHDNLITIKHALFVVFIVIILFLLTNICWMFIFYWYSSSLNNIIYQQNEILQQQTMVFSEILTFLQNNNNNVNESDIECIEGICN